MPKLTPTDDTGLNTASIPAPAAPNGTTTNAPGGRLAAGAQGGPANVGQARPPGSAVRPGVPMAGEGEVDGEGNLNAAGAVTAGAAYGAPAFGGRVGG